MGKKDDNEFEWDDTYTKIKQINWQRVSQTWLKRDVTYKIK